MFGFTFFRGLFGFLRLLAYPSQAWVFSGIFFSAVMGTVEWWFISFGGPVFTLCCCSFYYPYFYFVLVDRVRISVRSSSMRLVVGFSTTSGLLFLVPWFVRVFLSPSFFSVRALDYCEVVS